ncbi:MAG TPA: glycoside hydrolase family 30 beta sandwich domain-containing protein, partial [Caldilineaceae bacterium]|nr:glycoside hydrolase family 30 beta sandwich domain-containing protein [Caldilineaceae bacterium]
SLRPLGPVDFCLVAAGSGQLWVDRAVLLPADHIDGLDPDLLERIRWLAPPILRWPGGNFASTYHFWRGIGPLDERQTYPNTDWGGIDDNFFGVNEFLRLCALVNTEPHLCVNIGNGTPEEAAAWVEYVNGAADTHWGARRAADGHPEPYNVRLWEVGNEIYGPWQTGHCGAEENARRYRVWAEAMRKVDPTLELIATGNCFDFVEPHHHWHETLLAEGGEHVESIALHALPNNFRQVDEHMDLSELWHSLMAHPFRWEVTDLPQLLALARQLVPDRRVDLAITEWGILGDTQRPQVGNLGGAIYAALFLNMAIRQQEHIRVANATALFHGGCLRKAGPFLYHDPQVEVIRRYTELSGGMRLPVAYTGPAYDVSNGVRATPTVANVPWLDAIAVRRPDGEVVVVVVNRHAGEATRFTLASDKPLRPSRFEVMTGHMREMNTPLAPDQVIFKQQPCPASAPQLSLRLPPRAIGWLVCTISE